MYSYQKSAKTTSNTQDTKKHRVQTNTQYALVNATNKWTEGDYYWNEDRHGRRTYSTYGINNELIYQYNQQWAFGARFSVLNNGSHDLYYKSDSEYYYYNGIDQLRPNTNWYTIGLGANWTPNKWLTIKPEVRYDWVDDSGYYGPFYYHHDFYYDSSGPASHRNQFSGGVSAVVKF